MLIQIQKIKNLIKDEEKLIGTKQSLCANEVAYLKVMIGKLGKEVKGLERMYKKETQREKIKKLELENMKLLLRLQDAFTLIWDICHIMQTEMKYKVEGRLDQIRRDIYQKRQELYESGISETEELEKFFKEQTIDRKGKQKYNL